MILKLADWNIKNMSNSELIKGILAIIWIIFVQLCGYIAIIKFLYRKICNRKAKRKGRISRPSTALAVFDDSQSAQDTLPAKEAREEKDTSSHDRVTFEKPEFFFTLQEVPEPYQSRYIVFGQLFILERHRYCWSCHELIPVISFALKGYIKRNEKRDTKHSMDDKILLLSDISPLPTGLAKTLYSKFGFKSNMKGRNKQYNACVKCHKKQGNFYLYDEVYDCFGDGQFNGDPLDSDALFYEVKFQTPIEITTSEEGWSYIPPNSDVGRTAGDFFEWDCQGEPQISLFSGE